MSYKTRLCSKLGQKSLPGKVTEYGEKGFYKWFQFRQNRETNLGDCKILKTYKNLFPYVIKIFFIPNTAV